MHLVLLTRGHIREVEEWSKFMQTIPFNFPVKNLMEGTTTINTLWGALRPMQLWEFVFPEKTTVGNIECDSLDFIMNTLGLTQDHSKIAHRPYMDKYLWAVRKAMHLEEIPKIKETLRYPFPQKYVEVVPIGWKKDEAGSLIESPHLEHEKI